MKVILSKLLPSVWFATVMASYSLIFIPVSGLAADTHSGAGQEQQTSDAATEGDFPLLPRPQSDSPVSEERVPPSENYPAAVSAPEDRLLPEVPNAPNTDNATLVTRPVSYNAIVNTNITVKDMGQPNGLLLSGGQLQSGIVFTLPNDLVITNAKLSLALKISPELASKNYSLQLMLNGQPLGAIPLNQASDKSAIYQVDVPAAMVVATNNLSMSITGDNSALQCETDQLNKFWVSILPTSSIHLEGQQLNLGKNLGVFPRPFFDIMQMKETKVVMAFPANIRADVIAAAAGVASWFGYQANYRDIDFPVQFDSLPEGNGIIFGKPGEHIGDLVLP